MDDRPIGVFDSGLGGLTAVKELEAVLPGESIVYFGDTGRVPYGTRSRDTVRTYARQDMGFLMSQGVKAVLTACGTVSSTSADIGAQLPVPYFDVILPTARAAAKATRGGRIGIIATSATIHSGAYARALADLDPALQAFSQACPLFVPLVENGFVDPDEEITRLVAQRYLAPLQEAGVDTLILGCTHFPLLAPILRKVLGPEVALIDSGREAALALADALREQDLLCRPATPRTARYFVTDTPESFVSVAELFLGHPVSEPRLVTNIESYGPIESY